MYSKHLHLKNSGHGVDNIHIEVKEGTGDSKSPYNECLVGTSGDLYSIHDLKHDLVQEQAKRIFVTLDCCRDIPQRSRNGHTNTCILRYII